MLSTIFKKVFGKAVNVENVESHVAGYAGDCDLWVDIFTDGSTEPYQITVRGGTATLEEPLVGDFIWVFPSYWGIPFGDAIPCSGWLLLSRERHS